MKKPLIIGIVILIVVTIAGIGGYYYYFQSQSKTSGQVMKIAKYHWPGTYWVEIAQEKGWFKEAGLNVELVDTNADYIKSLDDVAAGIIDTANFSPFDLVSYNSKGADLVAVVNSDVSNGTDGIVAKPGIDAVTELVGKKVAFPKGSYLEYMFDEVLRLNHLNARKDIIHIEATPEESVQGLISGKYDAIVNWQPNLSSAASAVNGKIIFDTSQIKGLNSGNWVFKRNLILERPKDIQAFVNVWSRTTDFIKQDPDDAFGIIANIYNVPVEEVANLAEIDNITSVSEAMKFYAFSSGFESIHGSVKRASEYLVENELISKPILSTDIIDPRFIKNLIN